jgi:hypothetical protein
MSHSNDNLIIKEVITSANVALINESNESNESNDLQEVAFSTENEYIHDPDTRLDFNRKNIEAMSKYIQVVDSDPDSKIEMFCYNKCTEEDNSLIKQCRGVVFDGDNLVMKAFPYTSELNNTETGLVNSFVIDFENWSFYDSHEGACVRMFFHKGKWFLSTHRKLNAFKSKWASRESFGTSFKNALLEEEENNPLFKKGLPTGENILERFQETLDISKQYMFLICNTKDNRIVCSAPSRPTVYHVGTFVDGLLVVSDDVNININIKMPVKLKFDSSSQLIEYVKNVNYRDIQGVIGFNNNNKQLKILNKDYQDLFSARGNEPSIKFRYLQIRMNPDMVNMLYHLYPDMTDSFEDYENTLFEIGLSIYKAYVNRFIKKQYTIVPQEEFSIMSKCHSWHMSDRENNRISVDKIIRIMNEQTPTHLNHMIRRFKIVKIDDVSEKLKPLMYKKRSEKLNKVDTPIIIERKPLYIPQNKNIQE